MTNPLIAQAHDTDENFAGTGVLSDLTKCWTGLSGDASALTTAVTGVSSGLGLLGVAMAPLSALASAGVGWLIEHFDFLEQPLEELTGDPAAIEAQAQTWRNVAKQVRGSAGEYSSKVATVSATWRGQGSGAYQGAADAFGNSLQASADGAEGAAAAIEGAGVLVGVERGLIRDMISEFVGWLIVEAGIAIATSWCSFGASVAAFVGFAVGQGLRLASNIADRLAALSTKLDELSQLASRMNGSFDQLTGAIRQLGNKVDTASANLASHVDNAGNLPITAQGRVDEFFQGTQSQADSAASGLARVREGDLNIQQKTTERVAEMNVPGTNRSLRDTFGTNALDGHNYMSRNNSDGSVSPSKISDDSSWSTGDSVKAGSAVTKSVTEQLTGSSDEADSHDSDSSQKGQNVNDHA